MHAYHSLNARIQMFYCVCMCVSVYECMYVGGRCTYINMYVCMHISMFYVYRWKCKNSNAFVHMYVCTVCMYVWADKFCMFLVGVTYIQADGSYIIATRSLNSEIDTKAKSSKNNGYIRSLVTITPMHIYIHTYIFMHSHYDVIESFYICMYVDTNVRKCKFI